MNEPAPQKPETDYAKYREQRRASRGTLWKKVTHQPWAQALRSAKRRAKKSGIPYALSPEWAIARWTGSCEMTKLPFNKVGEQAGLWSVSIDRIDNALGYTPTNCRFVLNAVNMMKSTGTDADVVIIAQALVANAAPHALH